MKAANIQSYGAPSVLRVRELPAPTVGDDEILVQVRATAVTQGDRRLRSADFPGVSAIPGRLMMGVFRPKNSVPGTVFAGRVVAVGSGVTRFAVGDDVFGGCDHGAHAELLCVKQGGRVAHLPAGMDYDEAAALPYGAMTALLFLRDHAELQRGQRLLVIGASGGVGRFAVQLGKHLGAEVTGVCSGRNAQMVRDLGADHVVDYTVQDFTDNGERYDVIFDTNDASGFGRCRGSLTPKGRYLSLHISLRVVAQMLLTSMTGGRRAVFGIALGTTADTEQVRELAEAGVFRPVIDRRYPLARIREAHARVETGRTSGCVVVTVAPAELAVAAAK